ncbi:MAG: hypothetical protein ACFCVH_19735 [Alphaproteobacteria bacterium]
MTGHAPTHTRTYRRLVEGTTINGTSLLSTDYLNHFNEIVMLLELSVDMPDMVAEIEQWQPKSYVQHFRDSGFSYGELAVAAYDHAPVAFRQPFDATVDEINRIITEVLPRVRTMLAGEHPGAARDRILLLAHALRAKIERASAIINGSRAEELDAKPETGGMIGQKDIDALFD